MGAHVRYGKLSTFQPLMLMPLARNGLRLVSYGGEDLPVFRYAVPALLLIEENLIGEVGGKNVAGEAHGNPILALHGKAVHLRVIYLVGLWLSIGQKLGDLLGGDVLLCDDEFQGRTSCSYVVATARAQRNTRRAHRTSVLPVLAGQYTRVALSLRKSHRRAALRARRATWQQPAQSRDALRKRA